MTIEEFYNKHNTLVYKVARSIAGGSPGMDCDDIAQEIWADLLNGEKWRKIEGKEQGYIKRVMWRAGSGYAERERLSYIHYSAEWIYTPREVRALFEEAYFKPELWESPPQKDDGVTINAKNVLVSLWDIQQAFDSLSESDRNVITRRYRDGEPFASNADAKALQRAIDKVTNALNGRMAAKSETTNIDVYENGDSIHA